MIKVLGVGSPFGDDQVGKKVSEILKSSKHLQPYIPKLLSVESHDRPGIRLLELMKDSKLVYLIDAVVTGDAIGTIYRLEDGEIDGFNGSLSTHGIGVTQALQLGRALKQLPEHLIFYGIAIEPALTGFDISKPVEAAIHQLAECIERDIVNNSVCDSAL